MSEVQDVFAVAILRVFQDLAAQIVVIDRCGHGAQTARPGHQNHVLRRAAEIPHHRQWRVGSSGIRCDERDRDDAVGQVTGKWSNLRELCQPGAVADDDEVPALQILGRARPSSSVENEDKVLVADRLRAEAPHHAQLPYRLLDLHVRESRLALVKDNESAPPSDTPRRPFQTCSRSWARSRPAAARGTSTTRARGAPRFSTSSSLTKLLEGKHVEIHGWDALNAALDVLRADRDRWLAEQAPLTRGA